MPIAEDFTRHVRDVLIRRATISNKEMKHALCVEQSPYRNRRPPRAVYLNLDQSPLGVIERFWRRVQVGSGCWLFTGYRKPRTGYGEFNLQGRMHKAHRVAFSLFVQTIPKGMYVLHMCDNGSCVNPFHLYLGTQLENMRDCKERGRHRPPTPMPDNKHGAKLTCFQVQEIRRRFAAGETNQTRLAEEYRVHQSAVSRIIARKRWQKL